MSSLDKLSSWKEIGNYFNKFSEKSLNEIFKKDNLSKLLIDIFDF